MKKILLDTHILIRRESNQTLAKRLGDVMRHAAKLGYEPVLHRSSVDEIKNDKNIPESKRSLLLSKVETYPKIDPQFSFYDDEDFLEKVHRPEVQREAEDLHLLYCLYKEEVDLLLTEDSEIAEKAVSLRISGKVKNLRQAAASFKRALNEKKPELADVPVFCFYKEGRRWFIGEEGKKLVSFEHMVGFERIHLLLHHENEPLSSYVLQSGGKIAGDQDPREETPREYRDDISVLSKIKGSGQKNQMIRQRMERLKSEIAVSRSPEEILEKQAEYERLEIYLKTEGENLKLTEKGPRSTVSKTIDAALSKIHNDKALSHISRYLSKQTIHKGGECCYRPLVNDTPIWKLYPDSE